MIEQAKEIIIKLINTEEDFIIVTALSRIYDFLEDDIHIAAYYSQKIYNIIPERYEKLNTIVQSLRFIQDYGEK
jgi:hypothetical protein